MLGWYSEIITGSHLGLFKNFLDSSLKKAFNINIYIRALIRFLHFEYDALNSNSLTGLNTAVLHTLIIIVINSNSCLFCFPCTFVLQSTQLSCSTKYAIMWSHAAKLQRPVEESSYKKREDLNPKYFTYNLSLKISNTTTTDISHKVVGHLQHQHINSAHREFYFLVTYLSHCKGQQFSRFF